MVTTTTGVAEAELIETGDKRDALGRRRTTPERRAELLAAYRQSGLTQTAFARREGITYSTFCTWAQAEREAGRMPPAPVGRKLRSSGEMKTAMPSPNPTPVVRFAEVALPSRASALEVTLPDGTVVRGGSVEELAALARALRRA